MMLVHIYISYDNYYYYYESKDTQESGTNYSTLTKNMSTKDTDILTM